MCVSHPAQCLPALSPRPSQVIPSSLSFAPSFLFSVTWGNEKEAILGNFLSKSDTDTEPKVILTPAGTADGFEGVPQSEAYTLVMVDPDAPSREDRKYGPIRHWVVRRDQSITLRAAINPFVQVSGLKPPTISEIESAAGAQAGKELLSPPADPLSALVTKPAICAYTPPNPPPGSGVHRYGAHSSPYV